MCWRAQGQVPAAGCLGNTFLHKELFCFMAMKAIRAVVQHAAYETDRSGETPGKEQSAVTAEQRSTAMGPPAAQGPLPCTAVLGAAGRAGICAVASQSHSSHFTLGWGERRSASLPSNGHPLPSRGVRAAGQFGL